jgi:phosphoglycolate phosphatase
MKEIDLMVFDLDGTLVNSAPDLIAAVNYTRNVLGLPVMEEEEVMSFVGDGADKLVERFIGRDLHHRREEAMTIFLAYYDEHLLDNTTLYPGAKDVLEFFSRKKKIIITNKRYRFTRKITDAMHITGWFEEIVGMDSTSFRKPDACVLVPFLERFNVDPTRAVVLGDGVSDVRLAVNAGVSSCAMLNGFTPRDTLLSLKPDFVCENRLELKEMFC